VRAEEVEAQSVDVDLEVELETVEVQRLVVEAGEFRSQEEEADSEALPRAAKAAAAVSVVR
jgi:hypothetical protein